MKIRVDDVRPIPDTSRDSKFVDISKTSLDMAILSYVRGVVILGGIIRHISFDHDLGGSVTGYDLLSWTLYTYKLLGSYVPKISLHTANPEGRKRMEALLAEYGIEETAI